MRSRGDRNTFLKFCAGDCLSFFPIVQGLDLFVIPSRHGIVAAAPEGMAPKDSPQRQSGAAKNAPFTQRVQRVLGAGWGKSAAPWFYGRDEFPIHPYRGGEEGYRGGGYAPDDFTKKISHGAVSRSQLVRSWKAASRLLASHVLRPAFYILWLFPVRL